MSARVRECFTCFNDIPGDTIPYNATAFTGSPGFGSDFDGSGTLEIHVCDSCLTERRTRVARLTVTRTETVRREPWDETADAVTWAKSTSVTGGRPAGETA